MFRITSTTLRFAIMLAALVAIVLAAPDAVGVAPNGLNCCP
jgi:hypothetical protein